MSKFIIRSTPCDAIEALSRRMDRQRRRKSKSRQARDHANRLPGAWLMDVQESYSDTAR